MNTTLDTKLLPCPHCGGEEHEIGVGDAGHSVTCHSFSCRSSTGQWHTREQAIDAWNRRVSPSQGEGPAADVVEAAKAVIADWDHRLPDGPESFKTNDELGFSYWSPAASMVSSEPMSRLRAALASLAPRAAQGTLADEQSGETSHVAVSDAMVAAVLAWVCDDVLPAYDIPSDVPRNDPELPDSCRAALTAAIGAGRQLSAIAHPLPLKEEVERVLASARVVVDACAGDNKPAIGWAREVRGEMDILLSRIRAGAQEGWKPIETAPKDGSTFLAFGSYVYEGDTAPTIYMGVAEYSDEPNWPWRDAEGLHRETFYSHWMPLPAAPSTEAKGGPRP